MPTFNAKIHDMPPLVGDISVPSGGVEPGLQRAVEEHFGTAVNPGTSACNEDAEMTPSQMWALARRVGVSLQALGVSDDESSPEPKPGQGSTGGIQSGKLPSQAQTVAVHPRLTESGSAPSIVSSSGDGVDSPATEGSKQQPEPEPRPHQGRGRVGLTRASALCRRSRQRRVAPRPGNGTRGGSRPP